MNTVEVPTFGIVPSQEAGSTLKANSFTIETIVQSIQNKEAVYAQETASCKCTVSCADSHSYVLFVKEAYLVLTKVCICESETLTGIR